MKFTGITVALLVVGMFGVVALLGIIYLQKGELQKEVDRIAVETKLIGAKSTESAEIAKLTKRVKELEEELAEARVDAGVTADAPTKGKGKGKEDEAIIKVVGNMMEDPAMKDMMRRQQGLAIRGRYADFFRDLGFSEEEEAAMIELLLDKEMIGTELGVKMGATLSDEENQAIGKVIWEERSRIDEEIKALLGDENLGSYEMFEDSRQERQQMNTFKQNLKGKGLELSVEAEQQLMDAMYSTRKNFNFRTDFMVESRQMHAQVAEKASAILSPDQLEAFKASQESELRLLETAIEIGRELGLQTESRIEVRIE